MNRLLICMFVLFALVTSNVGAQQPGVSVAEKEHAFLKMFTGNWTSESEGSPGPDQPSVKCKGTMASRMLGELWVVNELKGDMAGVPMSGLQTIGYDSSKKKYVGTWVDNMMNHMWQYQGTVDATSKVLTLDADGPSFFVEGKTAKYRDRYEFKSNDHIVATSSVQGDDGKWIVFMTGNMKRVAESSKGE